MTKKELQSEINRKANINVSLHGEIDSSGGYKGHIEGSSTDELYAFVAYIANACGKAFDQVAFRYGQKNPPTFTCYIDFDTNVLKPKKGFFKKLFG